MPFTPKDYVDIGLGIIGTGADIYNTITSSKNADKAYDLNKAALQQNDALAREQLNLLDKQNKEQNAIARENIDWQKNIAQQNFGLQQNQFDYQKRLNTLQMEREDNAIQRQVADLQAAGFSPLMASGGSPSSPLSSGSAPQYDVSGVSAAQGSYLQLAQQYAQLKQDSMNSHRSAKVQAYQSMASSKQASSFALANLVRGIKQDLNQQYWNIQNYRLNAEHQTKQNELLDEQIKTARASRNWNESHGWRNNNISSWLVSMLDNFMTPQEAANKVQELIDVAKEKGPEKAKEIIKELKNVAPDVKKSMEIQVDNLLDETKDKITKTVQPVIDFIDSSDMKKSVLTSQAFNAAFSNSKQYDYDSYFPWQKKVNQRRKSDIYKYLGQFYDEHRKWFGTKIDRATFQNFSTNQLKEFKNNPKEFIKNY